MAKTSNKKVNKANSSASGSTSSSAGLSMSRIAEEDESKREPADEPNSGFASYLRSGEGSCVLRRSLTQPNQFPSSWCGVHRCRNDENVCNCQHIDGVFHCCMAKYQRVHFHHS